MDADMTVTKAELIALAEKVGPLFIEDVEAYFAKRALSPSRLSANDEGVTDQECDHICMGECATEGCENCGLHYYESGGVGSYYCGACLRKIKALTTTKPEAADSEMQIGPETEAVLKRDNYHLTVEWIKGSKTFNARIYEPQGLPLSPALADALALACEHGTTSAATQPPTPASGEQMKGDDAIHELYLDALAEAEKAMRKFPQPNYVISKVAEEAGEVVKAAIHCAEGRETHAALVGEIRQAMAMLIRLYIEGDQVHGLSSPRAALRPEGAQS